MKRTRGSGGLTHKKGSPNWYALLWDHGRQRCISLKTINKLVAERKLQKMVEALDRGEPLPQDLSKIFYEDMRQVLIQDYQLTSRKSLFIGKDGQPKLRALKHLDEFFAGYRLPSINPAAITKFKLWRQSEGEAGGTTNRSLSALKRMFHLQIRDGKIQTMPFIGMFKEAPARKGFLDVDQFRALRQELPDHLRPFVTVAYYTAMRFSEIANLRWDQVDLERRVLRLCQGETKNDEPRVVPLNAEIVQMLGMLPRKSKFVFPGKRVDRPLSNLRKSWTKACKSACLEGTRFHDLRRSGVRNMRRAGVAREVIMRVSGHKTESMFRRYSIVDEGDLLDAANKLDAFLDSQQAVPVRPTNFDERMMRQPKVDKVQ
jgi:integrase